MNCNDVDRMLIGKPGAEPLFPKAEEHVRNCDRCRSLVRALSAAVVPEVPSPETIRRIEQRLRSDLHAVRPLPGPRYFVAWFIAIFLAAASLLTYLWGAAAIVVMSPGQITGILAVLFISSVLLADSLARQMLPASKHRFSPGRLLVAIVIASAAAFAIFFPFQNEQSYWAHAWACLRAGALGGAVAALPFWLILRRSAILSPALTGATAGLFAGLVGTVALDMHCPNLNAWHILASHLGAAVVCSLAGLTVGLVAESRSLQVRNV
jgi:hypothetical protein